MLRKIKDREDSIINGLHLKLALDEEFKIIAENFKAKAGAEMCIRDRYAFGSGIPADSVIEITVTKPGQEPNAYCKKDTNFGWFAVRCV